MNILNNIIQELILNQLLILHILHNFNMLCLVTSKGINITGVQTSRYKGNQSFNTGLLSQLLRYKIHFNRVNVPVNFSGNRISSFKSLYNISFNICFKDFLLQYSNILNLKGCPSVVYGQFACEYCRSLESLLGGPYRVMKTYTCSNGALKNLLGGPEYVGENFLCHYNDITTYDDCPKYVGGNFVYGGYDNKNQPSLEYIKSICLVKGKVIKSN